MQCEKLFARINELHDKYVQFWVDVVNLESPTEDKARVDAVGKYFIDRANERGWKVEVHPEKVSGDVVCITLNPDAKGKPVVFSGHMDTVHPVGLFGTPAARVDEKNIYGPGVLDCKGGTVASFMAIAAREDVGFTARPVKLILQSDEENSNRTSNKDTIAYMAEQSKDCAVFLNTEPYWKDYCTVARKGISKYRFTVNGKACHASVCHQGISAIAEASHKILELEKVKEPDGLTFNVGLIKGGTSVNTTPAQCTFDLDIRFPDEEAMKRSDEIVKRVAETSYLEGTTCELELLSRRVHMEENEKNLAALAELNRICRENGLTEMQPQHRAGGSDAADLTYRGIVCLDSIGTYGDGTHSIREYSTLESLDTCAKRLAAMAYCMK